MSFMDGPQLEIIIKFILEIYILKALLKHNPCIFWIQKTPSLHFCNLVLVKWKWELQIMDLQDQVYPAIQQFHYKIRILDFYRHNTNLCVLDTLIVFRNTSNPFLKFDKLRILLKTLPKYYPIKKCSFGSWFKILNKTPYAM